MVAREKPCPVSVRRGDASYVEVCGEKRRDEENLGNEEICESGEQTSRRERRRVREKKGVADSNVDGGRRCPVKVAGQRCRECVVGRRPFL
jgi:hypothetical protein